MSEVALVTAFRKRAVQLRNAANSVNAYRDKYSVTLLFVSANASR
jgi:hypothetical protein